MTQIAVTQVIAEVASRVRQCPKTTLIRAYVAAARQFCQDTRWLRRKVTGMTVVDTKHYLLGDDTHEEIFGIRSMSSRLGTDRWYPMTEQSATNNDPNATSDESKFYRYLPHAQFTLSSAPDNTYELDITVVVQPKPGVVSIDDSLLVNWNECFDAGALYRLLRIPDQPWTNINESNNQYKLFIDKINSGKSDAAVGYNAGAATTSRDGGPSAALRGRLQSI